MKRRVNKEQRTKKLNNTKILILALVAIVLIAVAILAIQIVSKEKNTAETIVEAEEEPTVVVLNKLKNINETSKSRPYAVMINNNHAAWPQCGLQDAYIVYEIVAEGGITRMMALYKDKDTAKIGSVRSARHYYIDYAEENDAIFVHWGGSPQAYSRIYAGIDDLDGMAAEGGAFFRDTSLRRDLEHTGFASMEKLKALASTKGYDRDTTKDLLLNYSADEVNLETVEGAKVANNVYIRYSDYHSTSYEYDDENKVYKRSMSGVDNVDLVTGEQYTAKNIITYQINNYTLNDGENKGRQELDNIGSGEGYYITNGYAVPITWEKASHEGQTIYKYKNGNEINVNDGNTFIQIQPKDQTLTIE